MSGSASASNTSTKGGTGFDPQTQEWINKIRQATYDAAGAPPPGANPLTGQAGQFYSDQMANAGRGAAALGGDQNALQGLMSPYTQNIIDAQDAEWDRINQRTQGQVGANATLSGAFGGSRHGVATGTALSQNNLAQASQIAGLRQAGFSDAMNRAGQLVNFGFGGAQGGQAIGDYQRNVDMQRDPNNWRLQTLKGGLMGTPYGTRSDTNEHRYAGESGFSIPFFGG
jgi:hypothetical protein